MILRQATGEMAEQRRGRIGEARRYAETRQLYAHEIPDTREQGIVHRGRRRVQRGVT